MNVSSGGLSSSRSEGVSLSQYVADDANWLYEQDFFDFSDEQMWSSEPASTLSSLNSDILRSSSITSNMTYLSKYVLPFEAELRAVVSPHARVLFSGEPILSPLYASVGAILETKQNNGSIASIPPFNAGMSPTNCDDIFTRLGLVPDSLFGGKQDIVFIVDTQEIYKFQLFMDHMIGWFLLQPQQINSKITREEEISLCLRQQVKIILVGAMGQTVKHAQYVRLLDDQSFTHAICMPHQMNRYGFDDQASEAVFNIDMGLWEADPPRLESPDHAKDFDVQQFLVDDLP